MFHFSPVTLRRLNKFKKIKHASISFWIIIVLFIISLFSDFIANDKPIFIHYNNRNYFPVIKFYRGDNFGLAKTDIPDYKELQKSKSFKIGGKNFMIFPVIPFGPDESLFYINGNPPTPPTLHNLLGTDERGRDILTRLLYGYRISFSFALIITFTSMALGVIIGAVQGYFGGLLDLSVQRIIEIISALPFLYIVIIVGSSLGTSFILLIAIFTFFGWMEISFYLRSDFYRLKESQFVEAARSAGAGDRRIMFRHILPNALTPVITFFPFNIIGAIFSLSALDFLGSVSPLLLHR